jgi:hypothetical protein
MKPTHGKSRQMAEIAFGDIQTQFFAKNSAAEELLSVAQLRDAKTQRLREARLAKELADQPASISAPSSRRIKAR